MFTSQRHAISESLQNAFIAQDFSKDPTYANAINLLQYVLTSHPPAYRLLKESIYYDVKARTVVHMKAFHRLAQLFSVLTIPVFNCFPLRRSWAPCYVTIDFEILCNNIMSVSLDSERSRLDYCGEAVNLDAVVFKSQEFDHRLAFRGAIQTDGVGVTVLKKCIDNLSRYKEKIKTDFEIPRYMHHLDSREHSEITDRCVVIDPGRRDLFYCVHEPLTAERPPKMCFTKPQQDSWPRKKKCRRILEGVKTDGILALERSLVNSASVDITQYSEFLGARSTSFEQLSNFYTNALTMHASRHPLHRNLRLCSYIQKQKGNKKLVKNIKQKFGVDAVMVMRNWSAPNTRFHEPIRGLGFRRLLKKVRLSALRQTWHPGLGQPTHLQSPPYRISSGSLVPKPSWKTFWSLDIPASAFTPWWRLIHDKISVAARLHAWQVAGVDSPMCRVCSCSIEDTYHFVVGCAPKWFYWKELLRILSISQNFANQNTVWTALVHLLSSDGLTPIPCQFLRSLGYAFSAFWKYHWRVVLQNEVWSHAGALSFFRMESQFTLGLSP